MFKLNYLYKKAKKDLKIEFTDNMDYVDLRNTIISELSKRTRKELLNERMKIMYGGDTFSKGFSISTIILPNSIAVIAIIISIFSKIFTDAINKQIIGLGYFIVLECLILIFYCVFLFFMKEKNKRYLQFKLECVNEALNQKRKRVRVICCKRYK